MKRELLPEDHLDDRDLARLLAAARDRRGVDGRAHPNARRDWLMIALMAHAGLSPGELLRLRAVDLLHGPEGASVAVQARSHAGTAATPRRVAIGRGVARALVRYLNRRGVYNTDRIFPLSIGALAKAVRRNAIAAGLAAKLRPYSLRHTFGVRAVRASHDVALVARQLGHVTTTATELYANPTPAATRRMLAAVERCA